ncbi:MAG: PEP-CTERM sorting domain-containing protein [Fimbriimonadaceae bacterium]|nr:PEP-CTERM sorting domain-containing protein [Fimbriimonadaceae bacterium]
MTPSSRILTLVSLVSVASASQAITFSNIQITSAPLSNGSGFSTNANSISFTTPNAIVGDPVDPLRGGLLTISYDADNFGVNIVASQVGVNLGAAIAGSGMIHFSETVYEIDGGGNIIGTPLGTVNHMFDQNNSSSFNATINLSRGVTRLRAVKMFEMSAPDTQALDLAGVAIVNQNLQVVPEPATLAALGLGAAALIRRRRKTA